MGRKAMKRRASDDDDSGSEAGAPVAKKSKSGPSSSSAQSSLRDDDGNTYWPIQKNRRVMISEFKGTTFVNIREYYEKDGKSLPGKKGISLTLAQYGDLLKAVPGINAELEKKTGQSFEAPDDTNTPAAKESSSKKAKANIDTTSEEEEDED